jgi:hypothetical protein
MKNLFVPFVAVVAMVPSVQAKVSKEEAAQLGMTGTPLTPMGAIRQGNESGSIPEWTGGITSPPPQWEKEKMHGDFDPFKDDSPLFVITAANYKAYEEKLTPGQKLMFERYPDSYKMIVYPTRRTAGYPDEIYRATIANATRTVALPNYGGLDGYGMYGGDLPAGVAFPIPKDGIEAQYSHQTMYTGKYYRRLGKAINAYNNGDIVVGDIEEYMMFPQQMSQAEREEKLDWLKDGWFGLIINIKGPARLVGPVTMAKATLTPTELYAYQYAAGQRRVRVAPDVGSYDNPAMGSDGLRTGDDRYFLFGKLDRYKFTLQGRKEIFVPYNNYKLARSDVKIKDIMHYPTLNQDLPRYELHRVWVVEAELLEGQSHQYAKRVLYYDEDSWTAQLQDVYDKRGEYWRFMEAFMINFWELPATDYWGDVHYDIPSGRYSTYTSWYNETSPPDFDAYLDKRFWSPQGLRLLGTR